MLAKAQGRRLPLRYHSRMPALRVIRALLMCVTGVAAALANPIAGHEPPAALQTLAEWRAAFEVEVTRRLQVPGDEQARYAGLAQQALDAAGRRLQGPQWVLVVDRHAHVQAALLYLAMPAPEPWQWLGATPVSTGRPGGFEHFLTPMGVHEHLVANPDFRAEGTRNAFGVRGYGEAGMRVFDFGWVQGQRTWGADAGSLSPMRLQMHATDPQLLEPRLGRRDSKGCVRIPASLDRFLDRRGVLDADYDASLAAGQHHWVLDPARMPTPWAGRFMVVLDTEREARPAWSPAPVVPPPVAAASQAVVSTC